MNSMVFFKTPSAQIASKNHPADQLFFRKSARIWRRYCVFEDSGACRSARSDSLRSPFSTLQWVFESFWVPRPPSHHVTPPQGARPARRRPRADCYVFPAVRRQLLSGANSGILEIGKTYAATGRPPCGRQVVQGIPKES